MTTFLAGYALGFSLILAIGAQNAFVLRQGLRQSHVFAVCLTCSLSEVVLVSIGVFGFGRIAELATWITTAMLWGGALFLFVYGGFCFRSAWRGSEGLQASEGAEMSLKAAILACLAFTWLNPHAILDTVILLGALAAQYGEDRGFFGAGAIAAAASFFFMLGYGARLLAPVFAKPTAWRVLDTLIGITMWAIALALILRH
ncbi:MAG: LysE/ArgO family amino acid transporter [Pseudomonadota bacterium]